jgi:site-specific DNA-methyltransferase (cytosine-N4-specific)
MSDYSYSVPEADGVGRWMTLRLKDRLQPFERELARRELQNLIEMPIESISGQDVTLRADKPDLLRDRLAYWRHIDLDGETSLTQQVRTESSVELSKENGLRAGVADEDLHVAARRVLRYGPHALHEYRGRFFPQLVRSLLNIAGVKDGGVVLDPMCGSGTTLIEALLLGCSAVGIDMNPLSVLMSRAKCASLRPGADDELEDALQTIRLRAARKRIPDRWRARWGQTEREYLERWFAPDVLVQLGTVATVIEELIADESVKSFFHICLSNILRPVSFQDDRDLRIRRSTSDASAASTLALFLREAERNVRSVVALHAVRSGALETFEVRQGDVRNLLQSALKRGEKYDAIVTSPPYATALPYIDTDRLSLVFFGLVPKDEIRDLERAMIGNREVTERERRAYWGQYQEYRCDLPPSARDVIDQIGSSYGPESGSALVGFRRRNLPALLAKYFMDMKHVLANFQTLISKSGSAFVVIGSNHTVDQGRRISIPTERILCDLAHLNGLKVIDVLPMDMLTSRDIFKKNVVKTESILWLKPR